MGLKALIVDDMLVYRRMFTEALERFGGLEVVAAAATGEAAVAVAKDQAIDLVFLDIFLPGMGARKAMERLRALHPSLIVIAVVSAGAAEGREMPAAFEAGAHAALVKPPPLKYEEALRLLEREVAHSFPVINMRLSMAGRPERLSEVPLRRSLGNAKPKPVAGPFGPTGFALLAIGSSTGGPPVLTRLLRRLPKEFPLPVVVAQHMPPNFVAFMAETMQPECALRLAEAREGDPVVPGTVLFAPGGRHMELCRTNGRVSVHITDDPPVHGVRPSADILFKSAGECYRGSRVLAVVMTGMGEDGLEGVRALKENGGYCITQSARTCAVYGMPKAVDQAGLSDISLDDEQIPVYVASLLRREWPDRG